MIGPTSRRPAIAPGAPSGSGHGLLTVAAALTAALAVPAGASDLTLTVPIEEFRWQTPARLAVYVDLSEDDRSLLRTHYNTTYRDDPHLIPRHPFLWEGEIPGMPTRALSPARRKTVTKHVEEVVEDWAAILEDVEVEMNPGSRNLAKCTGVIIFAFGDLPYPMLGFTAPSSVTLYKGFSQSTLKTHTQLTLVTVMVDEQFLGTTVGLKNVAAHEFGHALGFANHIPSPTGDEGVWTCLMQRYVSADAVRERYLGPSRFDVNSCVTQPGIYDIEDDRFAVLPLHYGVPDAEAPPPPEAKSVSRKRRRR